MAFCRHWFAIHPLFTRLPGWLQAYGWHLRNYAVGNNWLHNIGLLRSQRATAACFAIFVLIHNTLHGSTFLSNASHSTKAVLLHNEIEKRSDQRTFSHTLTHSDKISLSSLATPTLWFNRVFCRWCVSDIYVRPTGALVYSMYRIHVHCSDATFFREETC